MLKGGESHAKRAAGAVAGEAAGERLRFFAMGTNCEIRYVCDDERTSRAFAREASSWVQKFESKYSRYHPDSLISRINASAGRGWTTIDADAARMFSLADQVYVLTRGIIDPTTLPLLRIWNYQVDKPQVPKHDEVSDALRKVGWTRVRREKGRVYLPEAGMGLDLGGFGKEYAVDSVADLARHHGLENVLVDFGHDVRVMGRAPDGDQWTIGIEDPQHPGAIRARLVVKNGGIATSGDFIKFFEANGRRYGHIIDPRSGYPVSNDCLSVTVVANSCLEAGLLATTAFVLGSDDGIRLIEEYFGAEGCITCKDCEFQTRGFCQYVV